MNRENNFGNNNGNQFNGLNNNPNGMNNGNYFNQGMQGGMPQTPNPNQEMPQASNVNQGMPMNNQQVPPMQSGMPMNNGYNQPYGNVPNNGMDPNYNQMPMNGFGNGPIPPTNNQSNSNKNTIVGIIACVVVIALVVGVASLLGGGKKLTCEMSDEAFGLKMESKQIIKYKSKGDSTNKTTMTITSEEEFSDEEFDELEKSLKESIDDGDNDFVSGPKITKKDNNTIIVTGTTKEDYTDYTFDELKEHMEDIGYTCK